MFIPEFVCGLIVGIVATIAGFIVWSVWLAKKH